MNIKELKEKGKTQTKKVITTEDLYTELITIKQAGLVISEELMQQAKADLKLCPGGRVPYPTYYIEDDVVYMEC